MKSLVGCFQRQQWLRVCFLFHELGQRSCLLHLQLLPLIIRASSAASQSSPRKRIESPARVATLTGSESLPATISDQLQVQTHKLACFLTAGRLQMRLFHGCFFSPTAHNCWQQRNGSTCVSVIIPKGAENWSRMMVLASLTASHLLDCAVRSSMLSSARSRLLLSSLWQDIPELLVLSA